MPRSQHLGHAGDTSAPQGYSRSPLSLHSRQVSPQRPGPQRAWAGIEWKRLPTGFWVMIAGAALLFGAISASLGAVIALSVQNPQSVPHSLEEVRDGKLGFTLMNVETASKAKHIDARGKFVIVTMKVQNIGDRPHTYSADEQTLIDSAGREHKPHPSASTVLNAEDTTAMNPGFEVTVKVPFDIPVNATPAVLEVHDFVFSGGNYIRIP